MKEKIYFGTYTKKTSQGIYQATLDTKTKEVSTPEAAISIGGPTYIRLTAQGDLLAVESADNLGGIASYQTADSDFIDNNDVLHEGASPCYIGIDNQRKLAFSANYHKGEILVYRINADHTLTQTDQVVVTGKGPREEQDSAHVHFTDLTPDGRLAAVDLGSDRIYVFDILNDGTLKQVSVLKLAAGYGPRHLVFAPNGQYAYLAGELSSQISTLKYDQSSGSFSEIQTLPTIPADWTEHNGAAAIKISSDGKFVYLSNRGYNSIAVFAVQADNQLQLVQQISTEGDFPRDFSLDPSEEFVLCANQNTDNATLYSRNQENGKLTCIQQDIPLPEGVCVLFAGENDNSN
ncbi:6-phosphogluconolactonase [Ligilactobacillus salitolerans]|uniref:6-phosphogluconolactonase n=1 Tax=Ligilactobacillus salitolerans TaxID=1808352 RepID=A0A401ISX2_9LACO|nr:lactonase family protein [Ligilactobacillus salitolerans]GBG94607.1 6-phosphogluconolactonase [Ligilactobacillus salitolerans]